MAQISSFLLRLCCLSGSLSFCDAAAFLSPGSATELTTEDVKQTLLAELAGVGRADDVAIVEGFMNFTFMSLPKNEYDKLDAATVNYALHRYFVDKHGWYIRGLGASSGSVNQTTTRVLKTRASAYIQSLMEERLHGQGMGLHELAVFAVTLSELIHAESVSRMEAIYSALDLPLVGSVSERDANDAARYFFESYLHAREVVATTRPSLMEVSKLLMDVYPQLPWTMKWVTDTAQTAKWAGRGRRNPFAPERQFSFDNSVKLAHTLTHKFGGFQNLECATLKRKLVHMEHQGTGRVLLSTFYEMGGWDFTESVEYLRNQGALDETDPKRPSVVIPNYVNSKANCLSASNFYMICCSNECEGLMLTLERELHAAQVTPEQVAAVVARTPSESVSAPRNLSSALVSRLHQISDTNGGHVPLHGRLFTQWMHHAYPRECPYPHVVDHSATSLSPEEWLIANGLDSLDVAETEKGRIMSMMNSTAHDDLVLPWDLEEQLVSQHTVAIRRSRPFNLPKYLAAAAAFSSMAFSMLLSLRRSAAWGAPSPSLAGKDDRLMV